MQNAELCYRSLEVNTSLFSLQTLFYLKKHFTDPDLISENAASVDRKSVLKGKLFQR